MSKKQQKITTPYNMGYKDGQAGRTPQLNHGNQYAMGYRHGKVDKKGKADE